MMVCFPVSSILILEQEGGPAVRKMLTAVMSTPWFRGIKSQVITILGFELKGRGRRDDNGME